MLANGVTLYPLSTENPHFKWEKKTDKQKNTIQRIRLIIPMNLLAFQSLSLKKILGRPTSLSNNHSDCIFVWTFLKNKTANYTVYLQQKYENWEKMNIFLLQILSSSKNFDFYFLKYTTVPTTNWWSWNFLLLLLQLFVDVYSNSWL